MSYPPQSTSTPPSALPQAGVPSAAGALASPPPPPPPPKTAAPSTTLAPAQSPPTHGALPPPVPPPPRTSSHPQSTLHTPPSYPPPQQQEHVPLPEQGWVPDVLKSMNKTDLHHLLQTPALLHALLHHPTHAHPALKASAAALEAALEQTGALATRAALAAAALDSERDAAAAHLLSARAAEQSWRARETAVERALAPFAPRALHTRLVGAIAEQEDLCRAVEEGWVEQDGVASERDVAEWVRRVRDGRRVLELRRERRARWDEGRVGGWR